MIITYPGLECIKVQQGDLTVVFNPVSKKSKHKMTSFGADIVCISIWNDDMNGIETVARGDKDPFVVKGPGEYEANGLFIKGFESQSTYQGKEAINTIYTVTIDGITIAYLGALSFKELPGDLKEQLSEANVIVVPIGGDDVLSPSDAHDVAIKREPNIIIPIHHDVVGEPGSLKSFLKEAGQEELKEVDKLTIKKSDLDSKKGEVVVLKSLI
jgi:L-ascorbate metabolism protein UlaG (beta-lactamase superfamily)